ncbi:hypothetical protein quinque_012114 [Culex quinquefasciatus]
MARSCVKWNRCRRPEERVRRSRDPDELQEYLRRNWTSRPLGVYASRTGRQAQPWVPEARVTHTTPAVSPTAIVTPDDRSFTPFRCGNCRSRRRHLVPRNIPVATITATESANRYNPSTPETRQSGGRVHRSPGSVNKPRSVEAEGEERVRVRAEAADRQARAKSRRRRSAPVECVPDAWRRQRRRVAEAGENEQRQQ